MHSYIIVGNKADAIKKANTISPYKIIQEIDTFIIETNENIGIDTIRDIKKFLQSKPYKNTHQIIFIYHADLLTPQAQNSFLKTLEEPPPNTLIFLSTSNIDKLLPTVISRCQVIKTDQTPSQENIQENNFSDIFQNLKNLNNGEKVTLANQHAYPKTKAVSLCQQAIYFFKESLHKNPNQYTVSNLKLSNQTLNRIEKNVDPRLSLEYLFLHLLV